MTLVDANVLLDRATKDPNGSSWSLARLAEASKPGGIFINDIIQASLSHTFPESSLARRLSDPSIALTAPASF
jgi:hypothetical protein